MTPRRLRLCAEETAMPPALSTFSGTSPRTWCMRCRCGECSAASSLSSPMRREARLEPYGVPVRVLDDLPRRWRRTGPRFVRTDQYLHVPGAARRTVRFLEDRARVVLFYELFDFGCRGRLHGPKTLFLSHGNGIKPYLSGRDRVRLVAAHDYVAAPGPYGRSAMERRGFPPIPWSISVSRGPMRSWREGVRESSRRSWRQRSVTCATLASSPTYRPTGVRRPSIIWASI